MKLDIGSVENQRIWHSSHEVGTRQKNRES